MSKGFSNKIVKQRVQIRAEFYKILKVFKSAHPGQPPVIHQVLAQVSGVQIWLI